MVSNSIFNAKKIEQEKGVILEEFNMYEDAPMQYVEELFDEAVYGNQPVGRQVLGTKKAIREMKRKDFVDYTNRLYNTGNAVVGLAGAVDEKILAVLEKDFSNLKKGKRKGAPKAKKEFSKNILLRYKKSEQSHLALGFPAYSYDQPERITLNLISAILGGNMSSRLFSVIREKHGMAYYIRSYVNPLTDTGTFLIQSGLDNKRLEKAVSLIMREIAKFVAKGPSAGELKRAKEFIKGQMAIQMEDSENLINWVLKQHMLQKKTRDLDEYFADIDRVSVNDIKSVAKDVFKPSKVNMALIGPFKEENRFKRILKFS